jgi:hypothetical protein
MKPLRLLGVAALACAASVLSAAPAGAISIIRTPPDPTITATGVQSWSGGFFYDQVWSFSGSDFCGTATRTEFNQKISPYDVACGHNVFVGLWAPGPSGGGSWVESTTLISTAGGTSVTSLSSVGQVSGSFTVTCEGANMELYAYDLDQGTMIIGVPVPSFGCVVHRRIY